MKRTRRSLLFLLSLLCMLQSTADHFGSSYNQRTNQKGTDKSSPIAAKTVADSLNDQESTVRERALNALTHSPKPPPLETLRRAFAKAKGQEAIRLLSLLFEQEDSSLSVTVSAGFKNRSEAERLAIMTMLAGHADSQSMELVKLGLNDPAPAVQRVALMRIITFPAAAAIPLLDAYASHAPAQLRQIAEAVRHEVETRTLWPFLRTAASGQISASESSFFSHNGTMPVVSPDGKWIAYVETGWGRPGGTGGFGRSNLISISHVMRSDGMDDRVVSDMFLIGWLSDSERIATARDGFAAISDLKGNVVAELGQPLEAKYRVADRNDWRTSDLRSQFGASMPHQKHLDGMENFGFGEDAAASPDGKWYGPLRDHQDVFFLGADGQRIPLKLSVNLDRGVLAMWSPDGRYVQLTTETGWLIVDMQTHSSRTIQGVDRMSFSGDCDYRKCRWNPWSKDGRQITFLRGGQVWISDPNGEAAKQLTFDSTRKAFPTFSRDGRFVAYLTWQPDDRLHYTRLGPTDLWVVDIATTLATRVTAPSKGRINSLDWLDDHTLIFDRLEQEDGKSFWLSRRSSLKRLSVRMMQD